VIQGSFDKDLAQIVDIVIYTTLLEGDTGFFCGEAGLFRGNTGFFCGDVAYLCEDTGLFCGDIGLFCGDIGLFCGDIGLFCGRPCANWAYIDQYYCHLTSFQQKLFPLLR